jgi:hemerythrin-like domain-containing protein
MMLMEHEEGRGYVRAMLSAVALAENNDASAKPALIHNAQAYLRLLKEHIAKEDQVLFVMADDVIPEDEQKLLLRTFEEHEAQEMGAGVHEKYLGVAAELENSCP